MTRPRITGPAEQLEGAVEVAHRHAEDERRQAVEDARHELAQPRVLAVHAIAEDGVVVLHQRQEVAQLAEVELVVRVGVEDELAPAGGEAVAQGGAVAAVHVVADDAQPVPVLAGEFREDLGAAVAAAVVHDHDLVGGHEARRRRVRLAHRALDVSLLVVGGEHDGKRGRSQKRRS